MKCNNLQSLLQLSPVFRVFFYALVQYVSLTTFLTFPSIPSHPSFSLRGIHSTRVLFLLDLPSKILDLFCKYPSFSFQSLLRFLSSSFNFLFSGAQIVFEKVPNSEITHLFYFLTSFLILIVDT